MEFATNQDVRIAYDAQGSGPALVCVHANPFDHRLWLYQVARYAGTFRTVAVDLRGYGDSDKPDSPFTLRDMADDVLAAARAAGALPAVFMGASVGANIVLRIGLDNPELVKGVVFVGGGARPTATFANRIAGYLSDDVPAYHRVHIRSLVAPRFPDTALGAWLLELFLARSASLSGKCIAQIFRALSECDMSDRVGTLKAPLLVVNGEHDIALELSREVAREVAGSREVVIPGTGHACCLEDPVAFDAAVAPFLREIARRW